MADILPKLELCPYCRKQYKQLKSHLPYCKKVNWKKVRASLPSDTDINHSKAALLQAPKSMMLQKEPTKVDGEETHKKRQNKKRNTNLTKDRLYISDLEMGTDVQTSKDMKKQIKLTPQVTQSPTRPKRILFLTKNGRLVSAEKKSPGTNFTKYLPKPLGEDKSKYPAEYFWGSPSDQSSTNEDKKHSLSLLNDTKIEHSGQKLLAETLDLPFSVYESFPSLDRSQNSCATSQSKERGPKARDPPSHASSSGNNSEIQRRNIGTIFSTNYVNSSLHKTLQTGGMENHHIKHGAKKKEFHFALEALGKGSWNEECEGNKLSEVEVQKLDNIRDDPKKHVNNNEEKTPHHDNPGSVMLPSEDLTYEEFLSLAKLGNQSLSSLVVQYLQEEEDAYKTQFIQTDSVESKKSIPSEPDPDPKTWATHTVCHHQPLIPAWHYAPKNSITGLQVSGNKNLSRSMGLEWFPELYPGYLHLGVLPGRQQQWNIEVQKPHHNFPEVEGFLQVSLLERSLMDIKMGKLSSWFTVSNFSIMGVLGTVQKAWTKYQKYINLKKGSVGGITMLFAGYCVLCYSWSFKHLKLQRWRKHH